MGTLPAFNNLNSPTGGVNKISEQEFQLLRELIEKECAIAIGKEKMYLVESRLAKLLTESGCDTYGEFYQKVKNGFDHALKMKLVDAMTTKETLWFRDDHPYRILKDTLLPKLAERPGRPPIKIWSAASSTGQEPYSIAITALECARLKGYAHLAGAAGVQITATDISPSAIALCRLGRYDQIAMSRNMPNDMAQRYFEQQGNIWTINSQVKQMVSFRQFNLQDSFAPLGKFDMIFLRNVAIYFSTEFKIGLYKKLAQALNPGGYLMIGATESLVGLSEDFERLQDQKGVYYQVRG
jgi:chemotaxis protein methyltransferase CheR